MQILKQKYSVLRILLAACVGAVCNCMGIYFRYGFVIMTVVSSFAANLLLHRNCSWRKIWEGFLYSTFLMTIMQKGVEVLRKIYPAHQYGMIFLAVMWLTLSVCIRFLLKRTEQRYHKKIFAVVLIYGNKRKNVSALLDSGNRLCDPVSGKPVCVVERTALQDWKDEIQKENFIQIPFSSIGQTNGMLLGTTISQMIIYQDGMEIQIKQPLIAFYEGSLSPQSTYQMLLHENLLRNK